MQLSYSLKKYLLVFICLRSFDYSTYKLQKVLIYSYGLTVLENEQKHEITTVWYLQNKDQHPIYPFSVGKEIPGLRFLLSFYWSCNLGRKGWET